MKVKFKKISEDAKIPSFACEGDAGMDLYANEDIVVDPENIVAVPIGIKMELPKGYVAFVWDKSGLALNSGLKTMGGVIDSGFRGEVKVIIKNLSKKDIVIKKGQKVAQMIIQKYEVPEIEVVKELSKTERGEGGFGSTGLV